MSRREEIFDELQSKLKALDETLWERKANWPVVERWLSQFKAHPDLAQDEQIQMLFLASHFMYFGMKELRALLRALYRDIFRYKCIERIREKNNDTRDRTIIQNKFENALANTRFFGIGNPSESGSHLLYYFRQENCLGKQFFMHAHDIFSRTGFWRLSWNRLKDPSIDHYVFMDDLCGSGTQASLYAREIVGPLRKLKKGVRVSYYTLFATTTGLDQVRKLGFDDVATVVELDESFKCFSQASRIYKNEEEPFDRKKAEAIALQYGRRLEPGMSLGYKDGQLLIGFCHNTPDNSLPIIWFDEPDGVSWHPLFRRYPKKYGWEA